MFQGTLPQSVVRIVGKIVKEWNTKRIYVGCSGNFTIERNLDNGSEAEGYGATEYDSW